MGGGFFGAGDSTVTDGPSRYGNEPSQDSSSRSKAGETAESQVLNANASSDFANDDLATSDIAAQSGGAAQSLVQSNTTAGGAVRKKRRKKGSAGADADEAGSGGEGDEESDEDAEDEISSPEDDAGGGDAGGRDLQEEAPSEGGAQNSTATQQLSIPAAADSGLLFKKEELYSSHELAHQRPIVWEQKFGYLDKMVIQEGAREDEQKKRDLEERKRNEEVESKTAGSSSDLTAGQQTSLGASSASQMAQTHGGAFSGGAGNRSASNLAMARTAGPRPFGINGFSVRASEEPQHMPAQGFSSSDNFNKSNNNQSNLGASQSTGFGNVRRRLAKFQEKNGGKGLSSSVGFQGASAMSSTARSPARNNAAAATPSAGRFNMSRSYSGGFGSGLPNSGAGAMSNMIVQNDNHYDATNHSSLEDNHYGSSSGVQVGEGGALQASSPQGFLGEGALEELQRQHSISSSQFYPANDQKGDSIYSSTGGPPAAMGGGGNGILPPGSSSADVMIQSSSTGFNNFAARGPRGEGDVVHAGAAGEDPSIYETFADNPNINRNIPAYAKEQLRADSSSTVTGDAAASSAYNNYGFSSIQNGPGGASSKSAQMVHDPHLDPYHPANLDDPYSRKPFSPKSYSPNKSPAPALQPRPNAHAATAYSDFHPDKQRFPGSFQHPPDRYAQNPYSASNPYSTNVATPFGGAASGRGPPGGAARHYSDRRLDASMREFATFLKQWQDVYYGGDGECLHEDILHLSNPKIFKMRQIFPKNPLTGQKQK